MFNRLTPILAIDIETGGCRALQHPLVAIGICLCLPHPTGIIKTKKRFTFEFDTDKFEDRCWCEFWTNHQDKLEIYKSTKEKSTIQDFADYIDTLDNMYPNLMLISDNPSFDIYFLNTLYDRDLNRKPLLYRADGTYRLICDQNTYLYAMMKESKSLWISDADVIKKYQLEDTIQSKHDHYPENDAERIADLFIAVRSK